MLRRVVQENVDLVQGVFRPARRRFWHGVARSTLVVALPLLLVATFLLASHGVAVKGTEPPEVNLTAQAAAASAPARVLQTIPLFAAAAPSSRLPQEPPRPLAPEVFPLAVRTVVLDPGHGGVGVGTTGPHGLLEKDLALDIALRLERLLSARGFEVEMTRSTDVAVTLEDRARFANERRGDIFVSIHLNWLGGERRGVETFFLGATDDPYLTRLAAAENRESGYSLADFRGLLEKVYHHARQGESRRLAAAVQRSLYGSLRQISPDLRDRGVKRGPFAVLTSTEMPAILAEVSCLSSEEEARLLRLDEYRQYIAEALHRGIQDYADQIRGGTHRGS